MSLIMDYTMEEPSKIIWFYWFQTNVFSKKRELSHYIWILVTFYCFLNSMLNAARKLSAIIGSTKSWNSLFHPKIINKNDKFAVRDWLGCLKFINSLNCWCFLFDILQDLFDQSNLLISLNQNLIFDVTFHMELILLSFWVFQAIFHP